MHPALGAGADYGLGTIGTCLGPPPAGGPPSDQKKNPYVSCEKNCRENESDASIVGYITLFVNCNYKWNVEGPLKNRFMPHLELWGPLGPQRCWGGGL